jgi:hypothetical protein
VGGGSRAGGGADSGIDGGDAGASDGGDAGASDGGDAGALDSGTPEICDGIDNNNDGLVDNAPDGGPLTQACPLTLGVCATALSICDAGTWMPCDYGPNYQLTERNCDGLDNDCDGRIDTSRKVVLFSDAGTYPAVDLTSVRQQLVQVGTGFRLVVAGVVLDFDENLGAQVVSIPAPYRGNEWSRMFQDGPDWFRFQTYSVPGPSSTVCMDAQRMTGDGGSDLSDGGPDILFDTCWQPLVYQGSETIPVADGFVSAFGNAFAPGPSVVWTYYQVDGGLTVGSYDAGLCVAGQPYCDVLLDDAASRFIASQPGQDPLLISSFVPPNDPVLELQLANAAKNCSATVNPLGYECTTNYQTDWYFIDGGSVLPTFIGFPLSDVHGSPARALAVLFDAGYPTATFELAEVIDGGLQPYAHFDDYPLANDFKVINLGGQLQLVLWGEGQPVGFCPNCTINAFSAEYVCVP